MTPWWRESNWYWGGGRGELKEEHMIWRTKIQARVPLKDSIFFK
jgi:hypothetical protein